MPHSPQNNCKLPCTAQQFEVATINQLLLDVSQPPTLQNRSTETDASLQDGSAGRGAYTQAQQPGFDLLIPQGGRRELSSNKGHGMYTYALIDIYIIRHKL